MIANVDPKFREAVDSERQAAREAKDRKEIRKSEQSRLTRNQAAREWQLIVDDLQTCRVPKYEKGELVYVLNPGKIWDTFHGQDYRDILDPDSERPAASQFLSGLIVSLKAVIKDSFETIDNEELAAVLKVIAKTEEIGFRAAPSTKRTISGDYQVKRDLQQRYANLSTINV